jgi:hypothetical protein
MADFLLISATCLTGKNVILFRRHVPFDQRATAAAPTLWTNPDRTETRAGEEIVVGSSNNRFGVNRTVRRGGNGMGHSMAYRACERQKADQRCAAPKMPDHIAEQFGE